jgi:hypothetical protein
MCDGNSWITICTICTAHSTTCTLWGCHFGRPSQWGGGLDCTRWQAECKKTELNQAEPVWAEHLQSAWLTKVRFWDLIGVGGWRVWSFDLRRFTSTDQRKHERYQKLLDRWGQKRGGCTAHKYHQTP